MMVPVGVPLASAALTLSVTLLVTTAGLPETLSASVACCLMTSWKTEDWLAALLLSPE